MMRLLSVASAAIVVMGLSANTADNSVTPPTANCSDQFSYGIPAVPGEIQTICHAHYASFYDTDMKIPRLVVYHETSDQSLGCLPRKSSFHSDTQLRRQDRQIPKDYDGTGYDLGHNAPDQDMAYDQEALNDSYSTANIAPQKPGMNQQGWERLEEDVRAWAMERGLVMIYVGSIMDPHPQTIGQGIAIPRAFFKIVIDQKTNESIGFIMPNQNTPKGDMTPFIVTIAKIEEQSGISFALPPQTDKNKNVAMWHTASSDWRKKHKALCKSNPIVHDPVSPNETTLPDKHGLDWKEGDPIIVRPDLKQK